MMGPVTTRVWFLACPGTEPMDLAGPWSVLGHANEVLGARAFDIQLFSPFGAEVTTRHGLAFAGAQTLSLRKKPPDWAFVVGVGPRSAFPNERRQLVEWLRRRGREVGALASICTGAFLLAEAGLLEGRRAMTHWAFVDRLRQRFPGVQVQERGIFTRDGHIWSSAGVSAGIDLCLAMVEESHGHGVAMSVAKRLVLFLHRSGHQAQFSEQLELQSREPQALRGLCSFITSHLVEPLPVERLARHVAMSPRNLSRMCKREWGLAPAQLVRRHRLAESQRLLQRPQLSLAQVAQGAGLGDVSTLWRLFTRHFGVTPAVYRERFAAAAPGTQPP